MSRFFSKSINKLLLFFCVFMMCGGKNIKAINFSRHSMDICLGQKVILKPNSCSSNISWSTNNGNIATVDTGGVVNTVGTGRVLITARDLRNNSVDNFTLNVVSKETVRFTYVTPNTCNPNTDVSVYATTESYIEGMCFDIEYNGQKFSIPAVERFVEGNVHVWRGNFRSLGEGKYNVRAYSYVGGNWYTCNSATSSFLVKNNVHNKSQCEYGERRVSDEGLRFIASCEGVSPKLYNDHLANGILTLGYGHVVRPYRPFYTDITRREAWAMLIKTIDEGGFSQNVNNFLVGRNINFSQQQFDALVSFTYNLGSGWMRTNCGFRNTLINLGVSNVSLPEFPYIGTVNVEDGLRMRGGPGEDAPILGALRNGDQVHVLSACKFNGKWYRIRTMNNIDCFCCADFLSLTEKCVGGKSLNNVNRERLIENMAMFHHIGSKCNAGLLTRRFWELDIFLYGEYGINGRFCSRYPNRHGYPIPSCMRGRY